MSQNENNHSDQQAMHNLFERVNSAEIEPSPYLKTRVLAHVAEASRMKVKVRFWQFFSAGSFAMMCFVAVYAFQISQNFKTEPVSQQAYVIHVDFNQEDMAKVARAEVQLPDEVYFKSSKGVAQDIRQLSLPVHVKTAGRGKLPFVVSSAVEGEKSIKIRLFDDSNNLIREQILKFKFAKTTQQVSL